MKLLKVSVKIVIPRGSSTRGSQWSIGCIEQWSIFLTLFASFSPVDLQFIVEHYDDFSRDMLLLANPVEDKEPTVPEVFDLDSSLNVTPLLYDPFASPSPERFSYYNGNGNDSKDDSEDGELFAFSSGSVQDDEYAEIGIDLTKYVRHQWKQAHTHHTPTMCQPLH